MTSYYTAILGTQFTISKNIRVESRPNNHLAYIPVFTSLNAHVAPLNKMIVKFSNIYIILVEVPIFITVSIWYNMQRPISIIKANNMAKKTDKMHESIKSINKGYVPQRIFPIIFQMAKFLESRT